MLCRCYTTDPNTRWELCGVPECPPSPPPVGCFDPSDKGATYDGGAATTVSGYTCMDWALDDPHEHGFNDLPGNYCRNPDGEPGPWCYTTDPAKRWELCEVPECVGCYDPSDKGASCAWLPIQSTPHPVCPRALPQHANWRRDA